MLPDVAPVPPVRAPRAEVVVNGQRLDDLVLEASVLNNSFYAADTFRLSLRLDEAPGAPFGPAFWGEQDSAEVEIAVAMAGTTTQLIVGRVDDIDLDYDRREVRLSGRDFTADLIDAKTTEKWPNRTSSEIVADVAGRFGLVPVVTATSAQAGTYYDAEHARLTDDTTFWNLLTYLAEREGFDVYMKGRELHFEPPADAAQAKRWPLTYTPPTAARPIPDAPVTRFALRRNLTVAKDIAVRVVSWDPLTKRARVHEKRRTQSEVEVRRNRSPLDSQREQEAERAGRVDRNGERVSRSGQRVPPGRTYVFRVPRLTEEQAIKYATDMLRELSRHERTVDFDGPGDATVTTRDRMVLGGTGTSWDQEYRIDTIERRIGFDEGFTMKIRARTDPMGGQAVSQSAL